jgi:hypothetical protein
MFARVSLLVAARWKKVFASAETQPSPQEELNPFVSVEVDSLESQLG